MIDGMQRMPLYIVLFGDFIEFRMKVGNMLLHAQCMGSTEQHAIAGIHASKWEQSVKWRCQFVFLSSWIAVAARIHQCWDTEWNGFWEKSSLANWTWVHTSITIAMNILCGVSKRSNGNFPSDTSRQLRRTVYSTHLRAQHTHACTRKKIIIIAFA